MPTLNQLQKQKQEHKCLRRAAISLLARREHSRQELSFKLKLKDFLANDINAVLDDLQAEDYQSDARFSEMLIRSRMHKGRGSIRITAELKDRGVTANIIRDELNKYSDDDWHNIIIKLYNKNVSANIIDYLLRRGFPYPLIKSAIQSVQS